MMMSIGCRIHGQNLLLVLLLLVVVLFRWLLSRHGGNAPAPAATSAT